MNKLFGLSVLACVGLQTAEAQSLLTENQCAAIFKAGTPEPAVKYCLRHFPPPPPIPSRTIETAPIPTISGTGGSGTIGDGGSSSTQEEADDFAIIRSSEGDLYSLKKVIGAEELGDVSEFGALDPVDLSSIDKIEFDAQARSSVDD